MKKLLLLCLMLPLFAGSDLRAETTNTADTPVEVLAMRIQHLDEKELTAEADRWQQRLKDTVKRLNDAKEEVWHENQAIQAIEADAVDASPADTETEAAVERENQQKDESLEQLSALREERVQVIDRLNVVLDELSARLGLTEAGNEQDTVLAYRRYIDAVKAVDVDTSDWKALRSVVTSWLTSPEGGLRMARNVGEFVLIVLGFWLLSLLLGRLAGKAMNLVAGASQILRRFVRNMVRRITIAIGLLLGLAALEINITPLVAVIGAAGFVIAFALQNTLSNFASGLMIMFYKPFDIGDYVETDTVSGTVKSMTLVTTNMLTPDNKWLVVPNNELWGKVITNVTGSSERRVDLVFGISYDDDIAKAEQVLNEVLAAHPKVLEEPAPVIKVSELADSSVNLICRPWVKTEDYWTVYWDLMRSVKEHFDAAGISIPYPQSQLHVLMAKPGATPESG